MVWDCMQVWCCDPSAGRKGPAWKHKAPGAGALNWRGRRIKSRLMSSRCVQLEPVQQNRRDGAAADFQGTTFQSWRQLTFSRLQQAISNLSEHRFCVPYLGSTQAINCSRVFTLPFLIISSLDSFFFLKYSFFLRCC